MDNTTDNINATTAPDEARMAQELQKASRLARYAAINAEIIALIGNPDLRHESLRDCRVFVESQISDNWQLRGGPRERCVRFHLGLTRRGADGQPECFFSRDYRSQADLADALWTGRLDEPRDYMADRPESEIFAVG